MIRIILGVIVGFIVWSVVWVGSDQVLINAWKHYGAHQFEMEKAFYNGEPFAADMTILLVRLVISVVASLMAGFIAAFIAKENSRSTLILGVLLLLVGIAVQAVFWKVQPLWFHFLFLFLLIPMTVVGGRLKQTAAAS